MVNFQFEDCSWGKARLEKLREEIAHYFEGLEIEGIDEISIIINKPDVLIARELSHYKKHERTEKIFNYFRARWAMHGMRGLVMESGHRNYILIREDIGLPSILISIPHELAHFLVEPFSNKEREEIEDALEKGVLKNLSLPKSDPLVWSIAQTLFDSVFMLNEEMAAEYTLGQRWPEVIDARLRREQEGVSAKVAQYKKVRKEALEKYPDGITMDMLDHGKGREAIHAKFLEVTLTFVAATGPLMSAMLTGDINDSRIKGHRKEMKKILPDEVYEKINAFLKEMAPGLKKYRKTSVKNSVELSTKVITLIDELF